jgi:hypothetical protein
MLTSRVVARAISSAIMEALPISCVLVALSLTMPSSTAIGLSMSVVHLPLLLLLPLLPHLPALFLHLQHLPLPPCLGAPQHLQDQVSKNATIATNM